MYPNLFNPIVVGGITLKNRITQAPLYVGQANQDGTVSQATIDHYARRADAGTALVVVEASSVSPNSDNSTAYGIKIYHDNYLPGLTKLAGTIKENGAVSCIQIFHAGRYAGIQPSLSASAVSFTPKPDVTLTPKEMTIEEIGQAVGEFASAAKRAKEAGFDMVELHGATGYLIAQFLSPLTNIRTDQYGGRLENRLRFLLEILKVTKDATGGDFPVGIRFLADDFLPGGFSLEDAKVLAKKLDEGGIAYISITGGVYDSWVLPEIQKKLQEKGSLGYLAKEIKNTVSVPVFVGNRIASPGIAEKIIGSGSADAVALGRPLLRDPDYPTKAAEGRPEKISECISCFGCMGLVIKGERVRCVQIKGSQKV